MQRPSRFYAGLFIVTFVTLALEVINTRITSVVTWYYLGFFAISMAMVGMTAGALFVYFRGFSREPGAVADALARHSLHFALSLPACHLLTLTVRNLEPRVWTDPMNLVVLLAFTLYNAVPFFCSGVVVALCLTKTEFPIGKVYAIDLLGAGAGCLGAIALLESVDPTSALALLGGLAALAALLFKGAQSERPSSGIALAALALLAFGGANAALYPMALRIQHSKGAEVSRGALIDRWNSHSRILADDFVAATPPYLAAGKGAPQPVVKVASLTIDGSAQTVMTAFDGDPASVAWTKWDATNLAYHLIAPGGDAAVIGVGGGRDLLSALGGGAGTVTGVEFNSIFVDVIERDLRDVLKLGAMPNVKIEHAEGRSFMARKRDAYDSIQMTIIDTWASTTAGAMTLTENGLYTVEAWKTFLRALKPAGVYTVSRWFSPKHPAEMARTLSLSMAALMDEGAPDPRSRLAMAINGRIATIVLARSPFTPEQVAKLESTCEEMGFALVVSPGRAVADPALAKIVGSRSLAELSENVKDPYLALDPPHDSSPFFFNIVKPARWLDFSNRPSSASEGVILGNLQAGDTLMALMLAILALDMAAIFVPIFLHARRGGLRGSRLPAAVAYFILIGLGFMLVEIALMQRFSILLGHPIYSLIVVLFSVILSSGFASLVSEGRIDPRSPARWALPLAMFGATLLAIFLIQPAIDAAAARPLPVRVAVVLAFTLPAGALMGCFFPLGMRLVALHSREEMPWLWGINGGFGVLGSAFSVIIAMAWSINAALLIGGVCYAALAIPAAALGRGATGGDGA